MSIRFRGTPTKALDTAGKGRYAHVDAMRAFAVILVVVAHTNIGYIPGGSGVTIFFTISGFVITNLLLREQRTCGRFDVRSFYQRRFLKIAPPFLVLVLVPTLVYSLWGPITWLPVFLQVFFLFNWLGYLASGPIHILPGSSVVWSLAIEEQFYLVFAGLWVVLLRSRRPRVYLLALGACFAVGSALLRVVYSLAGVSAERISSGTDTRVEGIAIGVLVALVHTRWTGRGGERSRLRSFCERDATLIWALLLYLLSLAVRDAFFRDTFRYSMQSVAAALVILYGFGPGRSWLRKIFDWFAAHPIVQYVGLGSYSIYLAHDPVMRLVWPLFENWPTLARSPILVFIGVITGLVAWRLVEIPIVKLRRGAGRSKLIEITKSRPLSTD